MNYSVNSSGLVGATAGAALVAPPSGAVGAVGPGGALHGVLAISDGTNTCVVTVYHGVAATAGNEVAKLSIPATTVAPQSLIFNNPIKCSDGIFYVITGTGAKGLFYYSIGD